MRVLFQVITVGCISLALSGIPVFAQEAPAQDAQPLLVARQDKVDGKGEKGEKEKGEKGTAKQEETTAQQDLDKALETKITAETFAELGQVIRLSRSALKKGLDETNKKLANELLVSTLVQRGATISDQILTAESRDERWTQMRSIALTDLEDATKIDPLVKDAHYYIARLESLPGGDLKNGMEAIEVVIARVGDDAKARADALYVRGELQAEPAKAEEDFSQAIKLEPKEVKYLRARGSILILQNKVEQGLADFEAAIAIDPNHAGTYEAKGMALSLIQKWDDAVAAFDRAIEIAPEDAGGFLHRGRVRFIQGEFEKAIEDETKSIELDGQNAMPYLIRAQANVQLGKTDEAIQDATLILQNAPNFAPALRTRGMAHAAATNVEEALQDFESANELEPNDLTTLLQIGMLRSVRKEHRLALKAYEDALKLDKPHWAAYRGRGDTYLSLGKHKEAVADFEEALKQVPNDPGILNNLAWVLATSPEEGVRDGKRSITLATKACETTNYELPHIISTLAAGYAETGDFESAMKWSKQAVSLSKDALQENLSKELASYEAKKPWREKLDEPDMPLEPTEKDPKAKEKGAK